MLALLTAATASSLQGRRRSSTHLEKRWMRRKMTNDE
jgi:hypothetical protein